MAKDTEKLIRQLSLISYLMAERRPVTALEIRRDVEGYSGMNEDAFARRFYADRAEPPSRRITRCGPRTFTFQQSSSPTMSWRRCSLRSACSTANSPTPSRYGSRCSRSLGAARARWKLPISVRWRSASRPQLVGMSSPAGWQRSKRRSSATRRSPSITSQSPATKLARARLTPTTCSSAVVSSTCSATAMTAKRFASSA